VARSAAEDVSRQLTEWCRQRLAHFKVPSQVTVHMTLTNSRCQLIPSWGSLWSSVGLSAELCGALWGRNVQQSVCSVS
jgi:hypothetical protein